ncbi:MAG: class I SAM-dependent methyltransferase [Corynebacteriales bacterium]|nr:class I SAM-dependent methyltransferase [Mycobacteriales bacterium]
MARTVRLAAGRARALGVPTRGTTAPNRLRRMDRYLLHIGQHLLASVAEPLVVDLGYGSSPVTTVELYHRLRTLAPNVRVTGLELDPERVAAAKSAARPPGLEFKRGGFELAGLRPHFIRAANVLRQYDEASAGSAWETLRGGLAPQGLIIEGTCDEVGRTGSWITLDAAGPITLTLSIRLLSMPSPAIFAERLPKALIHHNVPGRRVHTLLAELDAAWRRAAPLAPYGPRQRWVQAVGELVAHGWPVQDTARRWRLGECTLDWAAVAA